MGGGLALGVKDTESLSRTKSMSRLCPCCGTYIFVCRLTTLRRNELATSPCLCRAKLPVSPNGRWRCLGCRRYRRPSTDRKHVAARRCRSSGACAELGAHRREMSGSLEDIVVLRRRPLTNTLDAFFECVASAALNACFPPASRPSLISCFGFLHAGCLVLKYGTQGDRSALLESMPTRKHIYICEVWCHGSSLGVAMRCCRQEL